MKDIEIEKDIFLTSEGLVVFKKLKIAAAADLHIGFEEALGEQLAHLQTKLILDKFMSVLGRYKIDDVVLNGDIKYTFGKESKQEWKEIRFFIREVMQKSRVVVVKGNHDFYLQNILREFQLLVSKEVEFENVLFTHGDEEIELQKNKFIVIGNEHPSLRLRDEIGASKKYPCFVYAKKEKVLVLPAVNPWAPGTDILGVDGKHFLSPLLRKVKLGDALVYPFDGEEIYSFKSVKDVRKMLLKR